jgi:hypothetical protein
MANSDCNLSSSYHGDLMHTVFDREYLNIIKQPRLPATVKRKITLSLRTAYTVCLCIALTYYLDFGSSGAYLAPIYSAISGGSLYVGLLFSLCSALYVIYSQ